MKTMWAVIKITSCPMSRVDVPVTDIRPSIPQFPEVAPQPFLLIKFAALSALHPGGAFNLEGEKYSMRVL